MIYIAQIIGWLTVLDGAVFLVEPGWIRIVARLLVKGRRLVILGALRLAGAVVLFVSAGQGRIPGLVVFGGIMLVLAGLPGLMVPLEQQKQAIIESTEQSSGLIRAASAVVLLVGVAIVFGAQA